MPIRPINRPAVSTPATPVIGSPTEPVASPAIAKPADPPKFPAPAKNYEVGYAKPPVHTRFQKGVSGNPRGRPRGAKSLKTIARELLTEKVDVRTVSGKKRMTKMEAAFHKLMEQAFSGNLKAMQPLLALYQAAVPDEPARAISPAASGSDAPAESLDEQDQAILDALKMMLRRESGDEQ